MVPGSLLARMVSVGFGFVVFVLGSVHVHCPACVLWVGFCWIWISLGLGWASAVYWPAFIFSLRSKAKKKKLCLHSTQSFLSAHKLGGSCFHIRLDMEDYDVALAFAEDKAKFDEYIRAIVVSQLNTEN
jgi:hypothetical protein